MFVSVPQLLTIDQLQKERDRDRETVLAIQKNLSLVKDKYTEELLKSEEDKGTLSRQRAEVSQMYALKDTRGYRFRGETVCKCRGLARSKGQR